MRIRGHAITAQLTAAAVMALASCVLAVPAADGAEVFAEAWVELGADARLEPLARAGALPVEGRRRLGPDRVEVRVLLPPGAEAAVRAQGFSVRVERADHRLGPPPEDYRTPEEGTRLLAELADRSERGRIVHLGQSVQGRPIDALVLGRDPSEAAPQYRIVGAHHGDEWSSFEVPLAVAEALVDRDGTDARVSRILDESTVWIVPYVNPDGVVAGDRHNANQVDLNRNYDWQWSADERQSGSRPFSEPETRALRALGLHSRPVAGLSAHSGAINLGWVWNWTPEPTDEALLLEVVAERYAEACTADDFWITNGAQWYLTFGDLNDWSYGRYGVPDYTLELTDPKAPPSSDIGAFVAWHLDAVLAFLDQPPTLSGRVVDAAGRPVEAQLALEGPNPSAAFYSDPVTGRFHRIAGPGDATLHVLAPGYGAVEVPVAPSQPGSDWVEVVLQAEGLEGGWAEPSVVRRAGTVRLPSPITGPVSLIRAGLPPVEVQAEDGVVELDPADLGAGWWTAVDAATGTTWPRLLWVDEPEGVVVDGWSIGAEGITVAGAGFGAGARAWAVVGAERTLVELPVLQESGDQLLLDAAGLDRGDRVDIGLWTSGSHIALQDALNPNSGSNPFADEGLRIATGCACTSQPGHLWGALGSIPWMALLARRRRK